MMFLKHRVWILPVLAASLLLMVSCEDDYIYDDKEPEWLGASIYDYLKELLARYDDAVWVKYNEDPPTEELDKAELQAVEDTAEVFGITAKEVDDIFQRVTVARMRSGEL